MPLLSVESPLVANSGPSQNRLLLTQSGHWRQALFSILLARIPPFLGILAAAYIKGRNRERDRTNAKTAKTVIEISKETRKNAQDVNDKSSGSSAERLRDRYNRDR